MNMQIGPMPANTVTQELSFEKSPVKQAEVRAAVAPPANRSPEEKKTDEIKDTVKDLEQIGLAFNRRLKFVIDHESKEVTIKVIDNETDKVIKELPPEELQRLHQRIRDTMGFLFDQRV
jgi:flagellar protein FlaG